MSIDGADGATAVTAAKDVTSVMGPGTMSVSGGLARRA